MSTRLGITVQLRDEASGAMRQVAQNIASSSKTIEQAQAQVAQAQRRVTLGFREQVTAAVGMATAGYSLYAIYDRISTQQRILAELQVSYQSAMAGLQRAQITYNRAVERYGEASAEAQAALARLQAYQERVAVYQVKLKEYQDNVNEAIVEGAMQAIPSMMLMMSQLRQVMAGFNLTTRLTTLSVRGLSRALLLSPIGIVTMAVTALTAALYHVT